VIGILLVSVIGFTVWYTLFRKDNDDAGLRASGTVEATELQVGFPMPGRIDSLHVQEGDRVAPGMVLASLDRTELRARREQAVAQIAAARAVLLEMERGFQDEEIAQAAAGRDAARRQVDDAQRDLERAQSLYDGGAVSRQLLDKAQTALDIAESQLKQAEERLKLLEKGYRRERIAAQQAQVEQAEAALRTLDATLDNMILIARAEGVVTIRHREPNEIVAAGAPVLTLRDMNDRWIRIFIREDRIGAVHLGQSALIATDTFPEKRYHGAISYISPEAEFTPKTVQTTEERVRLVYAVKVRITDDPEGDLKPGMPADVTLEQH
jgi:HlyD family secretion protein